MTDTIRVSWPAAPLVVAAPDDPGGARRIRGRAVPWNVDGAVLGGQRVRFLPGSIDPATRPPVLRDHDPGRPIGLVAGAADPGDGLDVDVRISNVPDGDHALVLAADGVLGAFSVGVDPVDFTYDNGTLVVAAAEWRELSLLTLGAFSGARVVDVAASAHQSEGPSTVTDTVELETDQAPDRVAAGVAPPAMLAALERDQTGPAPAVIPLAAAGPPPAALGLREVAGIVASAERRGLRAEAVQAEIRAALDNITTGDLGAAVITPSYLTEIRGIIGGSRPTVNALGGPRSLPASGMSIAYPEWTAVPAVDEQITEKTEVASNPVSIVMKTEAVRTWAGANDISLQAVERSSPSFLEAYLRAMAGSYAQKTNAAFVTRLLGTANVVTPPATPTWLNIFPALLSGIDPALTPDGSLFVAMSWDVGLSMMGVSVNNGPAFWSGQISLTGIEPTMTAAGLTLYVERALPAKTLLAGSANAANFYENAGAPADIRVVDVSLLGLDVGVYGYAAITVDYPDALAKVTLTALPTADAAAAGSSPTRSKTT